MPKEHGRSRKEMLRDQQLHYDGIENACSQDAMARLKSPAYRRTDVVGYMNDKYAGSKSVDLLLKTEPVIERSGDM